MERTKSVCEFCGAEISKSNIGKHLRRHQEHPETFIKGVWVLDHDGLVCQFCGKECKNRNSLCNHERQCKENPNRQIIDRSGERNPNYGKTSWCKGLTAETDGRVRQAGESRKAAYASGKFQPSFRDRHHTDATRDKLSEIGLASDYQRVCKSTIEYTTKSGEIVKLDSSYELRVAEILDDNDIEWVRPGPMEWVDQQGKSHHYFPDFLLVNYNLYLDPKNEYCFVAQSEKIKYIQNNYSNVIFMHESEITEDFIKALISQAGVTEAVL